MRRNTVYAAQAVAGESKRNGALVCLLFTALLGCAFMAGAVWAAQPWVR